MWQKNPITPIFLLFAAFGLVLLALSFAAAGIAQLAGCQLNEADVYHCVIFGEDRGELLYDMALLVWPAAAILGLGV